MPLRPYRKETLAAETDGAVSRNLDLVERLSRDLEGARLNDGVLLQDIAYTGTAVTLRTGLARKWLGYIVTKRNATETVAALDADNAENDKLTQITLSASGNVTFDLWVF